jgi:hypothetical protein
MSLLGIVACRDGTSSQSPSVRLLYARLAGAPQFDPRFLTVTLDAGGTRHVLDGAALSTRLLATPHSEWYTVPAGSDLRVRAALRSAGGDTAAAVEGTVPLRRGWWYHVVVQVGGENPNAHLVGVEAMHIPVRAAPVRAQTRPGASDSIYLSWAGASKSDRTIH